MVSDFAFYTNKNTLEKFIALSKKTLLFSRLTEISILMISFDWFVESL